METLRYVLAIVLVVLVPMILAFWLVIHSMSSVWKGRPLAMAYSTAAIAMLIVGLVTYINSAVLIGPALDFSWVIFIAGLVIYLASLRMSAVVRQHLSLATFAGVHEIKNKKANLITSGPFCVVRHPRYLMVLVGIVGWCFMAHHLYAYASAAACIIGFVVVIQLEERELSERFGSSYLEYKKNVPQIIPRIGDLKNLL